MLEVALYAALEVALPVETQVENPWDPEQVQVEGRVLLPDGASQRWPAFFDGVEWRWRYQPQQGGQHEVAVWVDGAEVQRFSFNALASDAPGPLHVDGYGLRAADGTPFVPLGLNLGWSAGGGTDDYDRWFAALAASGGTFARVWVTHFTDQDPEWSHLGDMDPVASQNLDTILDLAQQHGIRLMLVLWQHSELQCGMWSSWDTNPYNAVNGGPCADSACFFTQDDALRLQERFVRYAVARWGAHPALGAWEVMNELDGVDGVEIPVAAAWAQGWAQTIADLESGLHPVSWSYALTASLEGDQEWEGADFTQVHSYLFADVAPVVAGVGALFERWDPPVLVGEWGLDWFGIADVQDEDGLAWHNANWAALASGSAGNAFTWWWQEHIEPHDLWWRLEGPAAITAGLDLSTMAPVELVVEGDDVEALGRADDAAALVWIHDVRSTPPEPEQPLQEGVLLSLSGWTGMEARALDPSSGELLAQVNTCDGRLAVPPFTGDLVLLLERADCLEEQSCGCGRRPDGRGGWAAWSLLVLGVGARRRWLRGGTAGRAGQ